MNKLTGLETDIEYIDAKTLSKRIPFDSRTINDSLKNKIFINGTHYIKKGRSNMYAWERVYEDIFLNKLNPEAIKAEEERLNKLKVNLNFEFITTEELSLRLNLNPATIREHLNNLCRIPLPECAALGGG